MREGFTASSLRPSGKEISGRCKIKAKGSPLMDRLPAAIITRMRASFSNNIPGFVTSPLDKKKNTAQKSLSTNFEKNCCDSNFLDLVRSFAGILTNQGMKPYLEVN